MFDVERFNLPLVPVSATAFQPRGVYGKTVCLPLS